MRRGLGEWNIILGSRVLLRIVRELALWRPIIPIVILSVLLEALVHLVGHEMAVGLRRGSYHWLTLMVILLPIVWLTWLLLHRVTIIVFHV